MNAKESYVYDVFQNIADGYDRANLRISAGWHMIWKRTAVKRLCKAMGDKPAILDIGCGTGDMLRLISENRPDARLTGVDFSPNMLEKAGDNCSDIRDLELVQGNAMELPAADGAFDGVSISFALRNTADHERVLKEALRVLKPGGRLVCIDSFVPENPLIRPFYQIYFSAFMPFLGGGIRYLREYRWLKQSTRDFISPKELMRLMRKTGFRRIAYKRFLFGACVCVSGDRRIG